MTKEMAINILRGYVLGTNEQTHEAVFMAIKALKAESKHGHWIDDGKGLYKCSECGEFWVHWWVSVVPIERMNKMMKFCPNCGADMREVEDE